MDLQIEVVCGSPLRALAVQYTGGPVQGEALLAWAADNGFPGGHFREGVDGGAVFLRAHPFPLRAVIGDWVVIGEDGSLAVLTDLEFSKTWERLADHDLRV